MILINCFDFQIAGYDICESDIPYFISPGSSIISPNYPNKYEYNTDCNMTIRFSADQKVTIELIFFDTEYGTDTLKVYDGPEGDEITSLDGYLVDNAGYTYTSTGNAMYLHFSSDGSVVYDGFLLIAKAGNDNITYWIH